MPRQMTAAEIRQAFLDYFNEINHEIVPSAPLPQKDNPTLLFTNAGMNQFTDVFLGKEKRDYNRAASSQKCMRVSGKHNDLENVGPSPRHHTFFEMLGNFSFGDYFKAEAIDYAWTFLTELLELDKNRLWVTIYEEDDEADMLWQRYVAPERVRRFGKKDNYWEMGDVGPCGPSSEIFYYVGDIDQMNPDRINADDDEEFVEFWNLVFMQFDRDEAGNLTPLPRPSIDTGMGLERMARIMQGATTNYETDLFSPALDRVQQLLDDTDEERAAKYVGYRVIADHGRAATFLIGDGVLPGNTGAPYVLRMVIRRAARFGRTIGFNEPFLADIAQVFIDEMGDAYPDIRARADFIRKTITIEEERFARTLTNALQHLDDVILDCHHHHKTTIPGDIAFDLLATYGLPIEITRDIAEEHGMSVDEKGFVEAKAKHAAASGAGSFSQYEVGQNIYADLLKQLIDDGTLEPTGVDYDPYGGYAMNAPIVALLQDGAGVDTVSGSEVVEVVTLATPFYVEAGGEVSDTGTITTESGTMAVTDTMRPVAGLIVHKGKLVSGTLSVGQLADVVVDNTRRSDIRRNHTATHILHRELRAILGTHVTQQGSLVAPDRLRFDFSHNEPVSAEKLNTIEAAINDAILTNYDVFAEYMGQKEAIAAGAMALFGEKYGDIVRTVKIGPQGDYSMELCGGLHVQRTGDIGRFNFTYEGSVASGVRRVEAVTGRGAQAFVAQRLTQLETVADQLNAPIAEVEQRIEAIMHENRALHKELEQLRSQMIKSQFDTLWDTLQAVDGVNLLVGTVTGASAENLREMADWFRDRVGSGVAVLATVKDDHPLLVAVVTQDVIKRGVKAGDLVREVAKLVGGGGGGRPNLAQAGGRDATKLPSALATVPDLIRSALQ
ncbi:MAG: alanine--tRNA ligase [Anaerolineae bacterium]|nr:alanine--tRNA ligase [Anaerolineae bacterium]